MNGLEPQDAEGPYFNAPQQQPQQQPTPQSGKRKGDEDSPSGGGQRTKRNRYISIACNECKRRKIKCNGENPCKRCGNLSLDCVYAPNCCSTGFKDSEEFRSMSAQIQSLQEQVNDLYAQLNALRGGAPAPYSMQNSLPDASASYRNAISPAQSRATHTQYQGPTSNQYNFDVAKSSLQTMGIAEAEGVDEGVGNEIDPALGAPIQPQAPMAPMVTQFQKDPLWQLSKVEAIRLCKVYGEEMGTMYPLFDMEKTINHAQLLFSFIESAARNGLMRRDKPGFEPIGGHEANIVKMILANALTIEEYGQSQLGKELYDSCREQIENKLTGPVEIKGLILLVMAAEYNFQQDEEVQAYRIIGLAARLCLELGLHRRETLLRNFPNPEDLSWAVKLFWSIYALDRRWSFGTGMPFALQDSDIDSDLPEPAPSNTYLTALISYSRIASLVWRTTNETSPGDEINKEIVEYLDYEITRWYDSIDESMTFSPVQFLMDAGSVSRGQRRLQVILYLRRNQMRTHIYRPVLHSLINIMENRQAAQTVVDVAKDTIRVLTRLNEATDIYRTAQVLFNYFLTAALGVLFLAVSHAPNDFSTQVRDEFYQALDLVKGFSERSYIAQRLWKTIKGLKEVAPKLGLVSNQHQQHQQTKLADASDPHSAAALAMAGLSGHAVDEMAAYASVGNPNSLSNNGLSNGQQMSYELTGLFEAAGGPAPTANQSSSTPLDGANGYSSQGISADMSPPTTDFGGMYGNDGDFAKLIGGLF